jgi:hypothetical protein
MSFAGLLGPAAMRVGSAIDRIAEFASRAEARRTQTFRDGFVERFSAVLNARTANSANQTPAEGVDGTSTPATSLSPWQLFTGSKHATGEVAGAEKNINRRTDSANEPNSNEPNTVTTDPGNGFVNRNPSFHPAWTNAVSTIVDQQGNYAGEVALNPVHFPTLATAQSVQQLAEQVGVKGQLTTTVMQGGPTGRSAPEYNLMVNGDPYSAGLLARMMAMHPDNWQQYFADELKYMQSAESAVKVDYIASGMQKPVESGSGSA